MGQGSGVGIEDASAAAPALEAALADALKVARWNTGETHSADREAVVKSAVEACKRSGILLRDSPAKAINGLLEVLASCDWVKDEAQAEARKRMVETGHDAPAADEASATLANNVIAAARSTNRSIQWAAVADDCPLNDLLRLIFRRAMPLVGVSWRARSAGWHLITAAKMGRFAREPMCANALHGGSGQTAITVIVATRVATAADFHSLVGADDVDEMVVAFLANRIRAMRKTLLPGFTAQDRRAVEARFAELAIQFPALLETVRNRDPEAHAARPPRPILASTPPQARNAPLREGMPDDSYRPEVGDAGAGTPWLVPLEDELIELELNGGRLAEDARVWRAQAPNLIQEARIALWESRDVQGMVWSGQWRRELQNQIRSHFRRRGADSPLDSRHRVEAALDDAPRATEKAPAPEARADPSPELLAGFDRMRQHFASLPGDSHEVVLIRELLAERVDYDDSGPLLRWEREIAPWVYREVERRGWDVDRDKLIASVRRALKAAVRELLDAEGGPK